MFWLLLNWLGALYGGRDVTIDDVPVLDVSESLTRVDLGEGRV